MKTFLTIWFGQFASQIGTGMTRFALLVWAYEQTGSATSVALLGFFSFLPLIAVSPFAGVWVDRLDRRKVMLLADAGAGLMTAGMLVLYLSGRLEIWHLYLAETLAGTFEAFQVPAYTAAVTLLLPKQHFARAAGLRSLAGNSSQVIAPFLAGLLLVAIGLGGVMTLDLITFGIAAVTLLTSRIPRPEIEPQPDTPETKRERFRQDIQVGFRFIRSRPGLFHLMLLFTGINFFAALTYFSVLPAMILARSGGDELALASVQSMLGGAGVVGGLLVSLWGGPQRKVHAILIGAALSFACGDFLFAIGRSLPVWLTGAAVSAIFIPFIISNNQAIWQSKVPPKVQGRVFSAYAMIRMSLMPVGYLMGGILADRLLEPAMLPGGSLVGTFGPLVGVGPGAGIGIMFLGTAICGFLMSLSGYLSPSLRIVERALPDFDEI